MACATISVVGLFRPTATRSVTWFVPVVGAASDLKLADEHASDELTVLSECTPHTSAYFNKGIVGSQRVSRDPAKEAQGTSHPPSLASLIKKEGDPLRDALGGLLKNEILKLLADAEGGQLYAALHELNDPELIEALEAMK